MKKLMLLSFFCVSMLFGAINLQTASKEELMGIKGIGEKKAEQIIEYRKTNKINSAEDLKNIKGFGDSIVKNVNEENLVEDKIKEVKSEKKEKIEENLNKKIEEKTSKTKATN